MKGGYYRLDYNENLSILALNTLLYNPKNNRDLQSDIVYEQFTWLENQLKQGGPQKKFILTFHIYPGVKYVYGIEDDWNEEFSKIYFGIVNKYHQKIIMEIGAHDHTSDLRYHEGETSGTEY